MLSLLDAKSLGYPSLNLSATTGVGSPHLSGSESSCASCMAYRTEPELDGNLRVDPEIHLPSPGMDVDVAYFYNANQNYNGPFGYGRTLSTNLIAQAQAAATPAWVSFLRGNGAVVSYAYDSGSSTYLPQTTNSLNSLQLDVPNGYWKETTPEGQITAYPFNSLGQIASVTYVQDAVGNRHTFLYDGQGHLQTLQDAVERRVTFGYSNGLLSTVSDWANRVTTFQYDATSIPGSPLLTTVIGPSGCQTAYGYDSTPLLNRVTDPNGYSTTYAYDDSGRVIQRTIGGVGTSIYKYIGGAMRATEPDGAVTTHLLSADWNILGVVTPSNYRVTVTRNSRGLETSRIDPLGAVTTTVYDTAGIIPIATIDSLGHATTYLRDAYNNPTTILYADGRSQGMVWGYSGSPFDTTGVKRRLQALIDPAGQRTSYSYNPRGQMTSVQDALGHVTTYSYDASGNTRSTQDANGAFTTYSYDLAGNVTQTMNPLGFVASATYDAQNRRLTSTNPLGQTQTTAYDSIGNATIRIDPLGQRTTATYNVFDKPRTVQNAAGFVSTYNYDTQGRMIESVDPLGFTTTVVYDLSGRMAAQINALGYRTSVLYDPASRSQVAIDALGNATTTIYDLAGRAVASQDALGRFSTTSYDAANRPVAMVNALGQISTTLYDAAGRPQTFIDPLGRASTTLYDRTGRLQASIDPLGYRTSYLYDSVGRQIAIQDALGRLSTSIYDWAGQMVASQNALGAVTTTVYDPAGSAIGTQDALGQRFTTSYDGAGQVRSSLSALGFTTTFNHDAVGQQISVQDANGRLTTTLYDGAGQLRTQIDARGFATTLSYDAVGQMRSVEDARGFVTTMSYDARGSLFEQQDALGRRTSWIYDAVGNATRQTDGRGLVTTMGYDALDRLTTRLFTSGRQTTFAFDAAGQQALMADESGVTSYDYDGVGRLRSVTAPETGTLTSTYDAVGNRLALGEAKVGATVSSYDALDRRTRLQDPFGEVTSFSYDALDRETSRVLSNGVSLQKGFDADGRLVSQSYQTSASVMRLRHTLTYDRIGNLLSQMELDGALTTFAYDTRDQLLTEERSKTGAYARSYLYDGTGNRLVQNADGVLTTSSYDGANQIKTAQTGAVTTTYLYDGAGNRSLERAGSALTSFTWNEENKLVELQAPTGEVQNLVYAGDGDLRRQTVTVSGVTQSDVRLLKDGKVVLQERDATTSAVLRHYTNAGSEWGNLISLSQGQNLGVVGGFNASRFNASRFNESPPSVSRFFAFDHVGTTRLLLDATGSVVDDYLLSAFGVELAASGATINPFRFDGNWAYFRLRQNLLLAGARVYDPVTGTWLSLDPIGFEGDDWNLFRYVINNPINDKDPTGFGNGSLLGLLSGQLNFNGCSEGFVNEYLCALGEGEAGPIVNPGNATQNIDALAFGQGAILKVPDNCTLTISCNGGQIVDMSCDCIKIFKSRCSWQNPYKESYFMPLRSACNKPFPPISSCISSFLGRNLPTSPTNKIPTRLLY